MSTPPLDPIKVSVDDVIAYGIAAKAQERISRWMQLWAGSVLFAVTAGGFIAFATVIHQGSEAVAHFIADSAKAIVTTRLNEAVKSIADSSRADLDRQIAQVLSKADSDAKLRIGVLAAEVARQAKLTPQQTRALTDRVVRASAPQGREFCFFALHSGDRWPQVAFIRASGELIRAQPSTGDSLKAVEYTRSYSNWPVEQGSNFVLPTLAGAVQPGELVQVNDVKSFSGGFIWVAFTRLTPGRP